MYCKNASAICSNARSADNQRGTCEQWYGKAKARSDGHGFRVARSPRTPSVFSFPALAYNLGNFLRTLATPEQIKEWSLTCLKDKLTKIGAKVVSHGRYIAFQIAEVAISRNPSPTSCGSSPRCGRHLPRQQHEAFGVTRSSKTTGGVLMTEISPLTGLRRRADNLQPASVAYSDPSRLKNAVTGASLGRT